MNNFLKVFEKRLRNRNYAENTILTYSHYLGEFLASESISDPYQVRLNHIVKYLENKEYSSISVQNQTIGALKLFAKEFLNKKQVHLVKIKRPKKQKKLPKVIDSKHLLDCISKIDNLKHKAILSIGFSVGLRVSEVINLKIGDIDSKRNLILIRNAKGGKDRYVPLSSNLLNTLRAYYSKYKPTDYLFEGQFGGKYSSTSCNQLIKRYIGPESHFHQLRHSSFTTMLETGTDISLIQKIAGHRSPKTTQIYTHVSNQLLSSIRTPL